MAAREVGPVRRNTRTLDMFHCGWLMHS